MLFACEGVLKARPQNGVTFGTEVAHATTALQRVFQRWPASRMDSWAPLRFGPGFRSGRAFGARKPLGQPSHQHNTRFVHIPNHRK